MSYKFRLALPLIGLICTLGVPLGNHAQQQSVVPSPDGLQSPPPPDTVVRRTLNVTVTNRQGRFVRGLPRENFIVSDGKERLGITHFDQQDSPATVGLLFDVSGSMQDVYKKLNIGKINAVESAMSSFLRKGHAENEYFVIGFSKSPQVLLDRSRDHDAVQAAFRQLYVASPKGHTALFDACYVGVDKAASGAHAKQAIVLISDGEDNDSDYTMAKLKRLLSKDNVIVYPVILGLPSDQNSLNINAYIQMNELARISGGTVSYAIDERSFRAAMEAIAVELRVQYAIGIELADSTRKGGEHKLKVEVVPSPNPSGKPLKLYVRSRPGFSTTVTRH